MRWMPVAHCFGKARRGSVAGAQPMAGPCGGLYRDEVGMRREGIGCTAPWRGIPSSSLSAAGVSPALSSCGLAARSHPFPLTPTGTRARLPPRTPCQGRTGSTSRRHHSAWPAWMCRSATFGCAWVPPPQPCTATRWGDQSQACRPWGLLTGHESGRRPGVCMLLCIPLSLGIDAEETVMAPPLPCWPAGRVRACADAGRCTAI